MASTTQLTTQQWLDWSVEYVKNTSGLIVIPSPDTDMVVAEPEHLEADPVHWLQLYAAWANYYNSQTYLWRSAHRVLDDRYSSLFAKGVRHYLETTEKSIAKAEYFSRSDLDTMRDARTVAENRSQMFTTKYYSAESYRNMASRSITARESDRKYGG